MSYPTGLPLPLQDSYGFTPIDNDASEPMTGTQFMTRTSLDEPMTVSVSFSLTKAQEATFLAWLDTLDGSPFDMPVLLESGVATQSVYFIESGWPQLQSVGVNERQYRATLFVPDIVDPDDGNYGLLEFGAENSNNGDPEDWYNVLDLVINDILPEA